MLTLMHAMAIFQMYGVIPYIAFRRNMMATTRFDMRLEEEVKAKAEKAAALLGMKSLKEYVVQLMDENSTRVIAEHESIIVENDIFDRFMMACAEVVKPNQALVDAANLTREHAIK
jgi:uncharacterized protein (DUF1778 family)